MPMSASQFFTEATNAANQNLQEALAKANDQGTVTSDLLLRLAAVQADLAKAAALGVVAEAISSCNSPGQSIRYGMAEVAEAIREFRP